MYAGGAGKMGCKGEMDTTIASRVALVTVS